MAMLLCALKENGEGIPPEYKVTPCSSASAAWRPFMSSHALQELISGTPMDFSSCILVSAMPPRCSRAVYGGFRVIV